MSAPNVEDYQPEIDAIKTDGYAICDFELVDYGRALRALVKRNGLDLIISLSNGAWGFDIRDTDWSKRVRGAA